jgi:hypothetical protein
VPVTLTAGGDGVGGRWRAEIVRTEGVVDAASRVIYAVAEVVDPYGVLGISEQAELKMGTFVRAEIRGRRADAVIILPRAVLQPDDTVLIANDDRQLEIREVNVARAEPRKVYIADGIANGELVITTSLDAPIPGTKLAIRGEAPPTAPESEQAVSVASDEGGS